MGCTNDIKKQCAELLNQLGVDVTCQDLLLDFILQNVTAHILNITNQTSIPEQLIPTAIYQVVGEYLKLKKDSGNVDSFQINFDAAVSSISEGDTSVSFATGNGNLTPEQRLDNLIQYLLGSKEDDLYCYRKLKW